MIKRIMNFLFGKKYPIYDSEGNLMHRWGGFMAEWKKRYKKSEGLNWKNHSGKTFSEKNKKSALK